RAGPCPCPATGLALLAQPPARDVWRPGQKAVRGTAMATLEKAIELAARYHAGQKDKEGLPYITHPLRVMQRVQGADAQIVAVLHDALEDTKLTEADLRSAGFSENIIR